jgi:DNA-binding response OmpR family regulator
LLEYNLQGESLSGIARLGTMKILVVDDNKKLASLIRCAIETETHHTVRTALDGSDGYLVFLHFNPELIITDIDMPRKNGFELMRQVRMHNPMVRTIYLSADQDRFKSLLELEEEKYRADFLGKPFSLSELMDLL